MDYDTSTWDITSNFPKWLHWDLTQRCGLHCKYCHKKYLPIILYESNSTAKSKELHPEKIEDLVKQLAHKDITVDITGGEPFLSDNIWQLISQCIVNNISFQVITKKPFSEKQVKLLHSIGLKRITISLDSSVSDKVEYLVGRKGYYDRYLKSIDQLIKAGIDVDVKALVCNYTINELKELIMMLDHMHVSTVRLQEWNPSSYSLTCEHISDVEKYSGILSLSEENRSYVSGVLASLTNTNIEVLCSIAVKSDKIVEPSKCPLKHDRLFLRPDGQAYICGQLQEFVVGDVNKQTISEIWNSALVNTLRNPGRELFSGTKCYECEHFDKCNDISRCYGRTIAKHRRIFAPDEDRLCSYFGVE